MTDKELNIKDELTEFLLYTTPNHEVRVEILLHDETVWLTQKRMAELFGVDVSTINEHLKNIYRFEELQETATIGKFPIVQQEGGRAVKRELKFHNLDVLEGKGTISPSAWPETRRLRNITSSTRSSRLSLTLTALPKRSRGRNERFC